MHTGLPGFGPQESSTKHSLSARNQVPHREIKFTKIWKSECTHRFLADLGKLDGWFGVERGVYLGNNYYHYQSNYNQQQGGRLSSVQGDILWEDASPHDFSFWNNIRDCSLKRFNSSIIARLIFKFSPWSKKLFVNHSSRSGSYRLGGCMAIFSSLFWRSTECQFDQE